MAQEVNVPSKKESDVGPAAIQSSFQQLSAAASSLNAASDRLTKIINEIESVLKPLNIGLHCWVKMGPGWSAPDGSSGYYQLGYTKVSGKWGIALSEVSDYSDDDEVWAFNDAPRTLRLKAVDYIPQLLDELTKKTADATKDVTEKTEHAARLVTALKGGALK
jgi:hypothetical protein